MSMAIIYKQFTACYFPVQFHSRFVANSVIITS